MKAIEHNEKALECANYLSEYCREHHECRGCMFSFSQVCLLKWTKPDAWSQSIEKVMERREHVKNKL